MKTLRSGKTIDYDGSQLRGAWLREAFGLEPDAAVAFVGGCDVKPEHMIDIEDLAAEERIVARQMLHFIVEHADDDIERMAMRQRLLVMCVGESLFASGVPALRRDGDDLYVGGSGDDACLCRTTVCVADATGRRHGRQARKLSVSIATTSVSGTGLVHVGLNVDPAGAPVPAVGLAELGLEPGAVAEDVLRRYAAEIAGVHRATLKVRKAP